MIVYIVGFIFTVLASNCGGKCKKNLHKFYFWLLITILIPCVIAALRSYDIGTDVRGYAITMYSVAERSSSFSNYLSQNWLHVVTHKVISDMEIGYNFLVYVSAHFFHSFQVLLFLTEVLTVVPVYVGISRFREKIPLHISVFVFLTTYYNVSLNIMRQSIAMSFAFLALCYAINKSSWKRVVVVLVVGYLFHSSAIIGVLIVGLYIYMTHNQRGIFKLLNKRKRHVELGKLALIIVVGIVFIVFYQLIGNLLRILGLGAYARYLSEGTVFLPGQILLRLPLFLIIFLEWNHLKKEELNIFFIALLILDLLTSQLSGVNTQAIRISMYFAYTKLLLIPILYNGTRQKRIVRPAINLYLIAYWTYMFVITISGETYPYKFFFQ